MFKAIANFFFEAGQLSRTPRSGYQFLITPKQSVAEHMNRMGYIVYALGKMDGTVNIGKMLEMAMFHDFAEARVSDLGYVHQKYATVDESKAIKDATADIPFGSDIQAIIAAYEARESMEAKFVKDADNLELLLKLKEESDVGNAKAASWFEPTVARLQTDLGKQFARAILDTEYDDWWYADKGAAWWVTRHKT